MNIFVSFLLLKFEAVLYSDEIVLIKKYCIAFK